MWHVLWNCYWILSTYRSFFLKFLLILFIIDKSICFLRFLSELIVENIGSTDWIDCVVLFLDGDGASNVSVRLVIVWCAWFVVAHSDSMACLIEITLCWYCAIPVDWWISLIRELVECFARAVIEHIDGVVGYRAVGIIDGKLLP